MTGERRQESAGYVGYEYREISVPRKYASLCLDSYPCFGWEEDPNQGRPGRRRGPAIPAAPGPKEMETLCFRRARSISGKAELTRLQRNFDSCIAELRALERSKTTRAAAAALTAGVLGTAFMAGSTFAAVSTPPVVWLTILLAIPGFLGWILPYFLYRAMVRWKAAQIEPLMEQKYDEINEICERGSRLLH
ncbi:hypothetical protein [uncultured Flavonifractor sp.]|uniref:hypothetical protein n=1 Tax=uncultured Flavonifractor sp. TaxID=1193534 RepID=UPI00174B6763|nr:hypothetical protein [uncultured Flavonifractor sp.]